MGNFAARFLDREPERFSPDQQQSTALDGVEIYFDYVIQIYKKFESGA